MAEIKMEDIRTFAIIGHGKCGKTSISDHILFKAGVVNRLGSVEEGTSISDYTDEEKERKISISSGVLNCVHKGKSFYIVDTPGYTDFFGDTIAALTAVNFTVLVIDAGAGVQVNTRKSWEHCKKNKIPAIIVVNKVDGEHLVVHEIIKKIQDSLDPKCTPVNYPDATGTDFSKVINLLDKSAKLEGEAAEIQNKLFEDIIEGDEELLMRYLEDENIEVSELEGLLKKGIIEGGIIPVLFTSVVKDAGIVELMDFIADFGPCAADTGKRLLYKEAKEGENPEEVEYTVGPDEPFKGLIFKVLTDPYVGKLCFIKIMSGTAREGLTVNYPGGRKVLPLTQLLKMQGNSQEPVGKAIPGEIVSVAKIDEFKLGDSIFNEDKDLSFAPIEFPEPMVSMAVFAKSRGDEQKIGTSLKIFANEDALFKMEINEETHQMVIKGMGNLHLESVLSRMKQRFSLEVNTQLPKIAYKETIRGKSDVSYKHKKQTGGHGQYGEVFIRLEPLERGGGFEFADEVVGGVIPRQYLPAVEKGVVKTMKEGILAGFQIVDVKVSLYFGSYHSVDSSELAFKTASSKAFKDGFLKAQPVLLEPIDLVEIMIPAQYMGNITGDINGRRGRIEGMDLFGDMQVIKAIVPQAEIQTYSTELRSATGGEGSYSRKFSHYEIVPDNLTQKIMQKYKKEDTE